MDDLLPESRSNAAEFTVSEISNALKRTVEDAFAWDPLELGVPAERIAGVEAAVWCETVEDADDLFFLLLPRLAGVAEKGWSPPSEWAGHRARLRAQGPVWDALGLTWFRSSAVWDD